MKEKIEYKKVSFFIRFLSGLIFISCLFASIKLYGHLKSGPFSFYFIPYILAIVALFHISTSILFTGFAPKYLLSYHDKEVK